MKFKPVTDRYKFDNQVLVRDYPDYLITPIARWIQSVLSDASMMYWTQDIMHNKHRIQNDFLTSLNVYFRETFPTEPNQFIEFVLSDGVRTTEIVAMCLQNYANVKHSNELEYILSTGGSAYKVFRERDPYGDYDTGFSTLVDRVPNVVIDASSQALSDEKQLREAWVSCYSHHPDYEKTVSRCCDVLEKLLKETYFQSDPKPQIKKFVYSLRETPQKLQYKGVTIQEAPQQLTDLAEKFSDIRGQHTAGSGRSATKEEAEFVLHYTIFIWNMHN